MRIKIVVYIILLSLPINYVFTAEPSLKPVPESTGETLWKDFVSPVTTDAKSVFYYGAAATLLFAILEDQISDPTQEDIKDDRPLGSLSRLGDLAGQVYPNALYSVGMLFHGMLTGREDSYSRSLLMFKSTAYSSALTTFLKYTTREPREKSKNKDAFPSGHTTTAFAFASVIGAEHSWPYGLGAYTLASLVGLSRMNDNEHLLHQVVGGVVIGMSYGLSLYYRKESKSKSEGESDKSTAASAIQVLPTDRLDGAMVVYSLDFSI